MGTPNRISAQTVAQAALLSAVALVFLFAAGMLPTGWTGVTAVAGLAVAIAVSASGYLTGTLCYLVTGILSLLILPGKQVAILFISLFGLYPLLKIRMERLGSRIAAIAVKLVFFNVVLLLLLQFASQLLWGDLLDQWSYSVPLRPILCLVGSGIFLLYDFAFTKVMGMLQARLIPLLRRRLGHR